MKTNAINAVVGIAATAFFAMSSGPSSNAEAEFRDFLNTYRVGYGTTEEYSYRLGVFADNLNRMEELRIENPMATFGVNKFADRTPQEMQKLMGLIVPAGKNLSSVKHVAPTEINDVDWTNMWDSVKDQGQCGLCWVFSATAAFEARHELATKSKHVNTLHAEQELVDCDKQSQGCNGGWMDNAFQYLQSKPFCTESQYPYTARDGSCGVSKCSGGPSDKSYSDLPAGNEDAVLKELVNGPIAVAVDASNWSFYKSGVFSNCGTSLNHGVTLVQSTDSFVKIRNSWSAGWGEKGYIRLATKKNTCGYTNAASFPTF
jgi:C1A family cysteine protease